jgi:hypothetical protein
MSSFKNGTKASYQNFSFRGLLSRLPATIPRRYLSIAHSVPELQHSMKSALSSNFQAIEDNCDSLGSEKEGSWDFNFDHCDH